MTSGLKPKAMVLALATLAACAGPVLARGKHRPVPRHCVDGPYPFSWSGLFDNTAPHPNGCAPPVYSNGHFVGQDPDPFIRQGLRRDPESGYPSIDNNY